jgi:hypothetical protein
VYIMNFGEFIRIRQQGDPTNYDDLFIEEMVRDNMWYCHKTMNSKYRQSAWAEAKKFAKELQEQVEMKRNKNNGST